jgi:hypothetical protein
MPGRCVINGFDADMYPFLNLFKLASGPSSSPAWDFPSILDADGYPTADPDQAILYSVRLPAHAGNWVFRFQGTGRARIDRPGTVSTGGGFVTGATTSNINVTGTNARIVFTFTSTPTTLSFYWFSSGTFSGLSNAVLCLEEHEALIDAGEMFNPDFLEMLGPTELNPRIIRPLKWMNPNENCNHTRREHIGGLSRFTYRAAFHSDAWVGDLSGTDTYTNESVPDEPEDGHLVHAHVVNANTVNNPTLNGITITDMDVTTVSVGGMAAAQNASFVYNELLDRWLYKSGGLTEQMPIEVYISLANELERDIWYCFPHMMDDDGVEAIVSAFKSGLDAGRTVYFELSNEIWNFTAGFPQTNLYYNIGLALGLTDADNRQYYGAYGKRVREIAEIIGDVWAGATSPAMKRVLAFQAFGNTTLTETYRMNGTDLGPWGFDSAPNRPRDYVEVYSYATYYSGANLKATDASWTADNVDAVAEWADDYDSGDPVLMRSALDAVDADIRGATATQQTLKKLNDDIYPAWQTIAASHGKQIIAYEGALEIAAPSTSRLTALSKDTAYAARITALISAYRNDLRCRALVGSQFRQFMSQGNSVAPTWFVVGGGSQWSLLEGDLYSTRRDAYDAIKAYNAGYEPCRIQWG